MHVSQSQRMVHHLFLLDEGDLGWLGPEVVVLRQQVCRALVGVIRRHDSQGQDAAWLLLLSQLLEGQYGLHIHLDMHMM